MKKEAFFQQVYEAVSEIPEGKVFTYGGIAGLLGQPQRSRMVGQALSYAPPLDEIPCHRVVNHQGRLAPFFMEQKERLIAEGVTFKENGCVDLKEHLWRPYG